MKNEAEIGTALGIAALRGIARMNLRLLKNECISSDAFNRAARGALEDLTYVQRRFPDATSQEHWDEMRSELIKAWTPDPNGGYPPND
ncbi:hypothetical protein [Novosphingobium sp.]|uniref:hypothetical protein n=1 Tax=Novosphingobium sp. TaxID=1874826 RepID=UPI003B51AC56